MGGVNSQVVLTEEEVEAVIRDLGNLLAPFLVRMNWLRSVNRRNLMIRHLYPADCSGVPSSSGDGKNDFPFVRRRLSGWEHRFLLGSSGIRWLLKG